MKIHIINGPNLNLLGTRQPEIYGGRTFGDYMEELKSALPDIEFSYFQSNIEGEIINALHTAGLNGDAVIINPGGYTHTSVAIADAITAITIPVIEVHISNLLTREDFRHKSITGASCSGSVMGLGLDGYRLAAMALMKLKTR